MAGDYAVAFLSVLLIVFIEYNLFHLSEALRIVQGQ